MEQKKKRTRKKEVIKEIRDIKIMFSETSNGYVNARVSLPLSWLKDMKVTQDDRETEMTYSPRTKKITIRKKGSEVKEDKED
ncbi:hypothetical protein H3N56_10310 [Cetobacterium sp. 2A]|uniref:hypothetical protein n=1 Tax=Cetobacterium sp. 2A TaxID=2754723 RepID=UPI00163D19C4|nr:hypothetical protein [Cetobacterium sp. 2A]MBC2856833.1 hypothetical protein [Cetobacterium sp. 2A]